MSDVKDLDPSIKIELKQGIMDEHPGIAFYGESGREKVSRGGFMATTLSYNDKQKALKHLHEIEVPQNSKEISEALAHGDLRENAEYKAAKERQDMLNSSAAKMKDEIDRAQIVRVDEVDPSTIGFGTKVKLKSGEGNREEYTVLGPWESDPENGVISYLSPFGSELMNRKSGEELSFVINEREYAYKVEKIAVADFA